MSQSRRLLFYLALNVLVSACTTLAILVLWDRTHSQNTAPLALPASTAGSPAPALTPIQAGAAPAGSPEPDSSGSVILIDNVFGAGDLANEVVLIRRAGSGELSMTGWQVTNGEDTFTFPGLVLYTDGAVQIHSTAGVNTVVDLFWGLDHAVWQTGETVTLLDPAGKVFATYRIP